MLLTEFVRRKMEKKCMYAENTDLLNSIDGSCSINIRQVYLK